MDLLVIGSIVWSTEHHKTVKHIHSSQMVSLKSFVSRTVQNPKICSLESYKAEKKKQILTSVQPAAVSVGRFCWKK